MLIKIICVGKIKEKFYRDAVLEYVKRLSRYAKIEIVECADEKTPDNASALLCDQIKSIEGERILGRIRDNDHVISQSMAKCTLQRLFPIIWTILCSAEKVPLYSSSEEVLVFPGQFLPGQMKKSASPP